MSTTKQTPHTNTSISETKIPHEIAFVVKTDLVSVLLMYDEPNEDEQGGYVVALRLKSKKEPRRVGKHYAQKEDARYSAKRITEYFASLGSCLYLSLKTQELVIGGLRFSASAVDRLEYDEKSHDLKVHFSDERKDTPRHFSLYSKSDDKAMVHCVDLLNRNISRLNQSE